MNSLSKEERDILQNFYDRKKEKPGEKVEKLGRIQQLEEEVRKDIATLEQQMIKLKWLDPGKTLPLCLGTNCWFSRTLMAKIGVSWLLMGGRDISPILPYQLKKDGRILPELGQFVWQIENVDRKILGYCERNPTIPIEMVFQMMDKEALFSQFGVGELFLPRHRDLSGEKMFWGQFVTSGGIVEAVDSFDNVFYSLYDYVLEATYNFESIMWENRASQMFLLSPAGQLEDFLLQGVSDPEELRNKKKEFINETPISVREFGIHVC